MARLFFKGVPEEPTCSSCGRSQPKYEDEDGKILVCDEQCYVDWFAENSEEFAKQRFHDDFYEIE